MSAFASGSTSTVAVEDSPVPLQSVQSLDAPPPAPSGITTSARPHPSHQRRSAHRQLLLRRHVR